MSTTYRKLGAMTLRMLALVAIASLAQLFAAGGASACNFGSNGEVGSGCGSIPAVPEPKTCNGENCENTSINENVGNSCGGGDQPDKGPSSTATGGGSAGRNSGIGKPVGLFSGQENMSIVDMVVNGTTPISVVRSYNSGSQYDSPLGYGWAFQFDRRLYKYADNSVVIRSGCGARAKYLLVGGAYQAQNKGVQPALAEQGDGSFILTFSTGGRETYDAQGKLTASQDAAGNRQEFSYDSRGRLPLIGSSSFSLTPAVPSVVAYDYRLTKVAERLADGTLTGNNVVLAYNDATGRLQSVTASDGRVVTYQQDQTASAGNGNLLNVGGLNGVNSIYQYSDAKYAHSVTKIQEGSAADTAYVNAYDLNTGKVIKQTFGNDTYDFSYVTAIQTAVTHTVRNAANSVLASQKITYTFDGSGFPTVIEWQLTGGAKYKKELVRNASSSLVDSETLSEAPSSGAAYVLTSVINYKYDAAGNKTEESVTLASGEKITKSWSYDGGFVASEQIVSSAAPTRLFRTEYTFYYGADGKPKNIKEIKRRNDDGSFVVTSLTYNSNGRPLNVTLPSGTVFQSVFTGDKLTQTRWLVGANIIPQMQATYGYDARGNVSSMTDAKGNITTLAYDDRRRVTKVTNALGEEKYYRYTGKLLTEIEVGHTAAAGEGQITQFVYTAEGWLQAVKQKKDDGSLQTVATYTYNSCGQPLTEVSYRDGLPLTTTYEYDALGRLTKSTDPATNATQYRYDANGNRKAVVDAKNRETAYSYDALNRLRSVEQKGISPSAITAFSYDAAGNLLSVTDPESKTTTYAYDALSRQTRITQPMGQFVQYAYDAVGKLDYSINARGQKIDYSYTAWGAPLRTDYYPTASASSYSKRVEYGYDNNGNVTSVADSSISASPIYQITYDALNRTDVVSATYMPVAVSLNSDYDRYGNRNQLTLQDTAASVHSFTYNKLNQLSAFSLPGNQSFGISYYADAGLIKQITFPSGIVTAYQFTNAGLPQSISTTGTGGVLEQLGYTYDATSNITEVTSTRDGGVNAYGYDGLDRLTSATRPSGYGVANEAYSYDRVGNRELSDASQYDYDGNNRITKSPGLTYTYDGDGNQISRNDGSSYIYDSDNHLVVYVNGGTTASYAYDAFGRRIKKVVNGLTTFYIWDGGHLVAEYSGMGVSQKRYSYKPGDVGPIQVQDSSGIYSVNYDHLQAARSMTDNGQKFVWSLKHGAFGAGQPNQDPDGNGVAIVLNLRFAGQYYDQESGLSYNMHRDYDSSSGRYVQADPIGLSGGNNLYAYALNNPISYVDPLGEEPADDKDFWNSPDIRFSNNCYSYAFDLPRRDYPACTKPQPGRGFVSREELTTPDGLAKAVLLEKWSLGSPSPRKCQKGYHQVFSVIAEGQDYHWYRQAEDGSWWHKPGWGEITNLDADKNKISDPRRANRNYEPNYGPNYSEDGLFYCAPSHNFCTAP